MRALAIVHQPDAGPGVFADAAARCGWELEHWEIARGGAPAAEVRDYDAVMSFGGSAHADQEDRHPWLRAEKALLRSRLEAGRPLLGVCLGAQLLAEAAGAPARRAARPEIGWHQVRVDPAGAADPLIGPLAPQFTAFSWHAYECPLPPGAAALAGSDVCLQAFRLGAGAWGIQFHAEVTAGDARGWIDDYGNDPDAVATALDPVALRADTEQRIDAWNRLGEELCARFLAAAAALRS